MAIANRFVIGGCGLMVAGKVGGGGRGFIVHCADVSKSGGGRGVGGSYQGYVVRSLTGQYSSSQTMIK